MWSVHQEEMDAFGGQEVLMPMLHPKANWEKTGGWDKIDVLFKIKSRTEKDYALGQSEEEVVTPLVLSRVRTYKDLPLAVYQINWKFRDELRAKSGLLRGREFLMKDMYSFHETQEDFERFYEIMKKAYFKMYSRLGLVAKATEASGGGFSEKISYEFMILTDAGEDDILYCESCEFCVNVEIAKQKEGESCPKCGKNKLKKARASEAGNVFDLGQKYGKDFNLSITNKNGEKIYPVMGCYGVGVSRLMGILAELGNDEKGLMWPESVAPFKIHLIELGKDLGKSLYHKLSNLQGGKNNILYDDRDLKAGEKFNHADLISIPWRAIVSEKTGDKIELKRRGETESKLVTEEELRKIVNL